MLIGARRSSIFSSTRQQDSDAPSRLIFTPPHSHPSSLPNNSRTIIATVVVAVLFTCLSLQTQIASAAETNNNNNVNKNISFIDIDWQLNHILILPVGCDWAETFVWRVRLKCPNGHFFVPTRLQASTNRLQYCNNTTAYFDTGSRSLQRQNEFPFAKQARQMSSQHYADGIINRYDYPYFPIFNSSTATYWNCVGINDVNSNNNSSSNSDECVILIRASDFARKPPSHAFEAPASKVDADGEPLRSPLDELGAEMATLVLPGPYCSTVDMVDDPLYRTGGNVVKVAVDNQQQNQTKIDSKTYKPRSDGNNNDENGNNLALEEFDLFGDGVANHLQVGYSEDVFFVGNTHSVGSMRLSNCTMTLVPRSVERAAWLWANDSSLFRSALLANVHVAFVQMTYNGYATFYDDMAALHHDELWRDLFSIVDFNATAGTIRLSLNFNVRRAVDGKGVRVALAIYEIMVVGDEAASHLGRSWPYRYMSSSREFASRMLLLRNASVDECFLEPAYNDMPPPNNGSIIWPCLNPNFTWCIPTPLPNTTTTPPPTTTPPTFAVCPWWCIWLWFVIASLTACVILASGGFIIYHHYRHRAAYYLWPHRRYVRSNSPSLLLSTSWSRPTSSPMDGSYVEL